MISKLKKLDLFGSKVEFNFAGQKRSSSCYGLSITFICLVVLLTTVYISGVDIVQKRNPLTITSELFFQDPEEMVITPDTFSFAFGLETPGSLDHFINESIYQVKVKHVTTQKVNGGADIRTTKYIGVERCTGSNFGTLESKFSTLPLSQLYCLQINDTNIDELKLQGVYESSVYKILTISINKCKNSTDPNAVQCGTPDEINKKLNGGYFAIYYPNLGIDLKNFGEPAVQNRDSYFTSVTGTYQKYGQMWLKHVELATDTGYLFEQLDIDNLIQMDTVRELTSYAENPTGIMTFDLRVEKIKTYYKRSYVKLQDIFADVDGMATLLVLITFFIVKPYADLKFNEGIINEVFDIKQDDPKKGDDDKQKKKRERIQRRLRSLDSALSPHERVEDHILNKQKTIGDTSIIRHTETIMVSEVPPARDTFRNINLQTKTDEKDSSTYFKQNSVRTNKFSSRFPTGHIEPESADLNRQRTAVTELIKLNSVSTRVKPTRPQTLHLDHHLSDEHMTPKFDLLKIESATLMSGVEKLERIDRKIVEDDLEEMGSKTIDEQLDEIKSEKGNNEEQNVEIQSPKDVLSERKYLAKEKTSTKNETKHTSNDKNEIRMSIEDNLSALDEEESETQNQPKSVPKSSSNNNKSKCFGFTRKKNTQNIKISFFEFLLSFIWMPKGLKKKMDILEKGMKKVEKKLDIFSLLKNIREIEKLKILLLENDQLILFDNLPKPMLQLRDMKNTMSFSHYLLKKPTFDHFNMKGGINRKVLTSYRKLKNKALSTEIDLKLVHLYDEILNE